MPFNYFWVVNDLLYCGGFSSSTACFHCELRVVLIVVGRSHFYTDFSFLISVDEIRCFLFFSEGQISTGLLIVPLNEDFRGRGLDFCVEVSVSAHLSCLAQWRNVCHILTRRVKRVPFFIVHALECKPLKAFGLQLGEGLCKIELPQMAIPGLNHRTGTTTAFIRFRTDPPPRVGPDCCDGPDRL